MKVLFAIKTLGSAGGAERVMVEIANGLATRGHHVEVMSYDNREVVSFYPLDSKVHWRRLGLGVTGRPAMLIETLARMWGMRREVAVSKPDVAVGFMSSMYIPLGFALAGTGIPLIASDHTIRGRYEARPVERILLSVMPWFVKTVTVVSQEIMDSHPPFLRRHMIVIPNPVSIAISRRADVAGEGKRRKILLSVGRLHEQKDHATLIESFATISGEVPDWDLRIVGEGHLREQLHRQIDAYGLGERIFLQGVTRDIAAEYESAQLFVLPSLFESLGLVVLEALAHGLPVVAFADCAGANCLIQSGHNGALIAGECRAAALAEALRVLMINAERRQKLVPSRFELPGEFCLEQVLSRWEAVTSQWSRN